MPRASSSDKLLALELRADYDMAKAQVRVLKAAACRLVLEMAKAGREPTIEQHAQLCKLFDEAERLEEESLEYSPIAVGEKLEISLNYAWNTTHYARRKSERKLIKAGLEHLLQNGHRDPDDSA